MRGKKIWTSKTFWTNVVAVLAMIVQGITGKEIVSLEVQGTILAVINLILRLVTKEPIVWQ